MKQLLICATLLSIFTPSVIGQFDTTSTVLNDVIIRENRLQMRLSDASRNIEIITKQQIENAPVNSVAELLNYVVGVDVRQRGVQGVQSDVTIRGGTFDQVLVLLNGAKLFDPQTGHHSLNLPIGLNNIERIEILRGAAARVYGQNAFTGAINIVTKQPTESGVSGGVQVGDYGLYGGNLNITFPQSFMSHQLSVSYNQSGGYRPNSDFKIGNIFYQNQLFLFGKAKVNLLAGITERRFGASGFYNTINTSNERENIQTNFVNLDAPLSYGKWKITPRLSWRRNQDAYYFNALNDSTRNATLNFTLTQVLDAEVHSSRETGLGTLGLSLGYNDSKFFNKRLGNHLRTLWSGFVEHRFKFFNEKLDVTPGLFLAHYNDFGFQAFPGIDIGVRATEKLKIFANYGKTYRVPTFTDLYFFNAANKNNPDLKPEYAQNLEAGIKYTAAKWAFQLGVFQRDGRDIIDRVKNDTARSVPFRPTNQNRLLLRGVDASVHFNFDFLNKSRLEIAYYNAFDYDFKKVELLSRYALDFLSSQFSASFESGIFGKLRQNTRIRNCKRLSQAKDYTVVDSKLMWQETKFNIFVQASNIFNTSYAEQNNIPMPKRWFSMGCNFAF